MIIFWMVIGYLFLFIFRPYEYWPELGQYRVERIYMLFLLAAVLLWKEKRHIPHPVTNAVLVFFFALVVSSFWAISGEHAFNKVFDYFKILVFYLIIIATIKDEKQLKLFLMAYIAIMFVYIGKSAWEFFLNDRYLWRMGIKRMVGVDETYGDPNAFAASIAYSLPFLFAMLKCKFEDRRFRILLWGYGILSIVCITYTGSRSGMATAAVFLLLSTLSMSRKVIGLVAVVTVAISVWFMMPENYQTRFMTTFETGINESADASAQGRTYTLKKGVDMFKQNPLLGVGPGNFPKGLELFGDYSGLNAHNIYGLILGETGLVGTISFLLMVVLIIMTHRQVIKSSQGNDFLKLTSIASIQAIILLLFNGNFGGNLYRYNWLWIGAIGVLSTYFIGLRKKESVPGPEASSGRMIWKGRSARRFSTR